jgi:hypothetical protein
MAFQTTTDTNVAYLEQLLQRSIFDSDLREALVQHPEIFGAELESPSLPVAVAEQDMTFAELVSVDIEASCVRTCVSGVTLKCDGSTFKRTCRSGLTLRCDG